MTTSNRESTFDTHQKALKINLDSRFYGTFAEIGAGQEVVRWFFRVGGAARGDREKAAAKLEAPARRAAAHPRRQEAALAGEEAAEQGLVK